MYALRVALMSISAKSISNGKFPGELASVLALLEQSNAALTDQLGPQFCLEVRRLGPPITFLLNQAESFIEAKLKDAVVLDLGCGIGLTAATFAALGARRVIGVDTDPFLINLGKSLLSDGLPRHIAARVELHHTDVFHTPLDRGTFDAVTAIDALDEIPSAEEAAIMIRAHINPKGRVLISGPNNSWFLPGRIKRRVVWQSRELIEYSAIREQIIRDHFPNLAPEEVDRFVDRTVGHAAEDIVGLVRHALMTGTDPEPLRERMMMHPVTRRLEQREMDPIQLMHCFMRHGFHGRLLHPHTNDPPEPLHPKRLLKRGLRMLYPATLPAFAGFRLLMTDIRGISPNGAAPSRNG